MPEVMVDGLDESALERVTLRRVSVRLLPFLFILYIGNYLDRTNVAMAALQMNRDLHFRGSGIAFVRAVVANQLCLAVFG